MPYKDNMVCCIVKREGEIIMKFILERIGSTKKIWLAGTKVKKCCIALAIFAALRIWTVSIGDAIEKHEGAKKRKLWKGLLFKECKQLITK